jgi:hypothetical protein
VIVHAALVIAATALLGDAFDIAGNGDMPLLFFEALAAALLIGPWALEKEGQLMAGVMIAGAVSTKVEGLVFAISIGGLFLAARRREIRWPGAVLGLFVPPAACLTAWFAFGASRGLFSGYESYGRMLDIHWERVGLVAASIARELWAAGFALPFFLPLLVLLTVHGRWRLALIPLGTAALLAGFFFFTYLHGDPDPTSWIHWSAGRIFLPLTALVVIGAAARGVPEHVPSDGAMPERRRLDHPGEAGRQPKLRDSLRTRSGIRVQLT